MAWAKNGTPDTLSVTGTTIEITDLTAYKFNQILWSEYPNGNVDDPDATIDVGSTGDYAFRSSDNGGADATATSLNFWRLCSGNNTYTRFSVFEIININGEEKLAIHRIMRTLAGATNAPDRREHAYKVDTSTDSSQFTSFSINTVGNMATGSNLSAIGSD